MKHKLLYFTSIGCFTMLFSTALHAKYVVTYDVRGNIVSEVDSDCNGKSCHSYSTYKYDEHGNMVENTYENNGSVHTVTATNTYDNNENIVSQTWDSYPRVMKSDSWYAKGKTVCFSGGGTTSCQFDSHGNVLSYSDANGSFVNEYIYNNDGSIQQVTKKQVANYKGSQMNKTVGQEVYGVDGYGNYVRTQHCINGWDGSLNCSRGAAVTYDEYGNITGLNTSGWLFSVSTNQLDYYSLYDSEGNETRYDVNNNKKAMYSAEGNILVSYNTDGTYITYDSEGKEINRFNADGSIYVKPKRTSYTPAEAAQHVNHTNNNRVIFTFK